MKKHSFLFLVLSFLFILPFSAVFAQVPKTQSEMQFSFAPLVKKTASSVVNVYAARQIKVQSPFQGDPFFEQFFNRNIPNQSSRTQSSLGSGVIVDASGLIVTNYHVIRDADDIKIALSDGREFESSVVLKDEATDIAILKVTTKHNDFLALSLGNSDKVEVGDLVLAIGNPFGVGQTVTSGIVSAQARTSVGVSDFDFFIQTDAAINPGNSGGALIDMNGDLIGINTAIYSRSGGSIGIGFAIPVNLVKAVIDTVKRGGKTFEPPYIGATFQSVTSDVAESLGMKQPYGALITGIIKNSPADKAKFKIGDVILKAQNEKIDNPESLAYRLMTTGIGQNITIEYLRNDKIETTTILLIETPMDQKNTPEKLTGNTPFSGASVINLTPQNTRHYKLPLTATGIVIEAIDQNSISNGIFQIHDAIISVNGVNIKNVDDLKKLLNKGQPSFWQFEIYRNGTLIHQIIR